MIFMDDNFPLTEELDLIIPIGITHIFGKEPKITYYPEAEELALWLDSLSEKQLFSKDTLSLLEEKASEIPAFGCYLPDREHPCDYSYLYRLDDEKMLRENVIMPESRRILPGHGFVNLTDTEADMLDPDALIFGTVKDGRILSVAFENPCFGDSTGNLIDIGVETAEGFGGHGYGASNVAALCKALLSVDKSVSYIAQSSNQPSVRIAESVGFSCYGFEFQLALYRQD